MPIRTRSSSRAGRSADRLDHRQPGAHRPLGIVLMRLRIAEIDRGRHRPYIWRQTRRSGRPSRQRAVIGADQLAQILRVMTGRQRGRADQVAEHDRELAPFGDRRSGRLKQMSCRADVTAAAVGARAQGGDRMRAACGDDRSRSRPGRSSRRPSAPVTLRHRHRCRGMRARIAPAPTRAATPRHPSGDPRHRGGLAPHERGYPSARRPTSGRAEIGAASGVTASEGQ